MRGPNHHGRPLSELVVHDPCYCSWILRTAQERLANIFAAEAGLAVTVDSWMIVLQRCDLSAACLFDGAIYGYMQIARARIMTFAPARATFRRSYV